MQKVSSSLLVVPVVIFLLVFSVIAKHCCQDQCQGAFPPFSSNTFTVLGLTGKSLFFQVNFYEWYMGGGGPISLFCAWLSNFPNAIYWKVLWTPLSDISWLYVYVWVYFWALNFVSLAHVSVFMLVPHCFSYDKLLLSLKWATVPPSFSFFFFFGYSGSFVLPYKF